MGEIQKTKLLLKCVTMSLSSRNYLPPPNMVFKRVTENICPGYNEVRKLLYLIAFCKNKIKPKYPQNFLFY
jgi:hypothetical protein